MTDRCTSMGMIVPQQSMTDAELADLLKHNLEIKAAKHDVERLLNSVSTAEEEVDRLNAEIARLRSAPAAHVIEAARKVAFPIPCPPTAEIEQLDALEKRDRLRKALAEYDAALITEGTELADDIERGDHDIKP